MTDEPAIGVSEDGHWVVLNEPFTAKPARERARFSDRDRLKRIMDELANDGRIVWDHPLATKPNEFDSLFGEYGGLEGVLIVQSADTCDRFIGEPFRGFGLMIEEVECPGVGSLWFIGSMGDEAGFYNVKMKALRTLFKRHSIVRSFDDPEEVI